MSALAIESFAPDDPRRSAFDGVRGLPDAAPEPVAAGATCMLASRGGRPLARCTLAVAHGLHGAPGASGLVGHYEALEREAGVALLEDARRSLAAQDVARVLAPMNGSTWARYRLALPSQAGDAEFEPAHFLAEPRNPFEYPEHFESAGFSIAARYESRLDDRPGAEAPDVRAVAERVAAAGFTVRPLDPARFDAELDALFDLSLETFADNLYYTPIGREAFRAMYEPFRGRLDPDFVLLAHDARGRLAAYQFAFPDPMSARGGRPTRIVVKTVATAPAARGQGLANHMLDRLRSLAHARGYAALIHALMHVSNFSMRMSGRHETRVFRRYALYQWTP
ncbi:MAG TPA: GNAT family N-acetyltransferase [Candidatus Eisenbacteria bacterium]|jgi:GNAT superfamily N-acetyltransferase